MPTPPPRQPADETEPGLRSRTRRTWETLTGVLTLAFLGWAVPLWGMGYMRGRGAFDQHYFHIKAIRRFLAQWPAIDLSNYESATAPGYHLALAGVAKMIGDTPVALQAVASLFTIAMLGVAALLIARAASAARVTMPESCALALPLACSMYAVFPGVWLQPDNAAWLGVFAILALALPARRGFGWLIGGALILAALAFVRQNQVWGAAVLWAAAWLNAAPIPDGRISTLLNAPARRIPAALLAAIVSLPAFGVVAWLFRLWGGPVPPDFQNQHASGANPATPAFMLSLIAVYSLFLIAWLWPSLARLWRESRLLVLLAALAGAALGALPTTTFLVEPRSGGLWNLVKLEDRFGLIIAHRTSPGMATLSAMGAVALLGWLAAVRPRERWILGAALLAFTVAQTANSNCWQRYFEPFLLVCVALMALLGHRPEHNPASGPLSARKGGRIIGPVALALALGAVTLHGLMTGETLRW